MNGDNVTELLRFNVDQLEPSCLNRALMAAVQNDNQFNIGKLIVKGADNLRESLALATDPTNYKPRASAMLLMVKAACEGNINLVLRLFGEDSHSHDEAEFNDEGLSRVQKVIAEGSVSTVVPIEIARRHGNSAVRGELLLRTDVNQAEGTVYWHGLRLLVLDPSWLERISWVRRLRLARNCFRSLPSEMGAYLKQVSIHVNVHVHVHVPVHACEYRADTIYF